MPQFARPDADIVDGAWVKSTGGNVDMFTMIDEATPDDVDYIQSELAPAASAYAVRLSDVEDPLSDANHVVRYRYRKDAAGGATIGVTVQLRQGYVNESSQGTLIHSEVHANVGETWTAGTFTLTAPEAQAITDYSDLQLRFVANQT